MCLAICYQPTLLAWQLYLVGRAIWSILLEAASRGPLTLADIIYLLFAKFTASRRVSQKIFTVVPLNIDRLVKYWFYKSKQQFQLQQEAQQTLR